MYGSVCIIEKFRDTGVCTCFDLYENQKSNCNVSITNKFYFEIIMYDWVALKFLVIFKKYLFIS